MSSRAEQLREQAQGELALGRAVPLPPSDQPAVIAVPVVAEQVAPAWLAEAIPSAGKFSTGLFDCCKPSVCSGMYAYFCISCQIGQLAELFKPGEPACCAGSCPMACCAHWWLGGAWQVTAGLVFGLVGIAVPGPFTWLVSCPLRSDVRTKWQIGGGGCAAACEDCCLVFWCDPCTAVQEYKEMQIRLYGSAAAEQFADIRREIRQMNRADGRAADAGAEPDLPGYPSGYHPEMGNIGVAPTGAGPK